MERKEFSTLIKRNHEFGDELFTVGRITGIGFAESGYEIGYTIVEHSKGYIFTKRFTPEEYDSFRNIIEKFYPGLCIFKV